MTTELRDYLNSIYPEADDEQITSYYNLVLSHDLDSLPPTKAVKRYIEIKKQLKELEKEEDDLHSQITEQYNKLGHQISGLSISNPTTKTYDKDKLFEWGKSHIDIEDCYSTILDKDKVTNKVVEKILKQEINLEDLPLDLYKSKTSIRLEAKGLRSKK